MNFDIVIVGGGPADLRFARALKDTPLKIASGGDIAAPALLQSYERTHRRATLPLYVATHAVAKLFTSESTPSRMLRDAALKIGERVTPFKRLVAATLTGAR